MTQLENVMVLYGRITFTKPEVSTAEPELGTAQPQLVQYFLYSDDIQPDSNTECVVAR